MEHPGIDDSIMQLRRQIRRWILFFIVSISFFGITAFPLETELKWLNDLVASQDGAWAVWIRSVYEGLHETNLHFPFLAYGTDWLAYAHIIIALLFIGPLKDPVKNSWIIDWGILSCLLAVPVALIAGPVRGVPFFHRLIDAGISLFGLLPLLMVRSRIRQLQALLARQK